MSLKIRPATPSDIEASGRLLYAAFKDIADRHQFPPDFRSPEFAVRAASLLINHPSIFGVVAEDDGKIRGVNFLDERDEISGLGPVGVDPNCQGRGIGRQLMHAVLERGRGSAGIRLLADPFNTVSMALYASVGFNVKELTMLISGRPRSHPYAGFEVRRLRSEDVGKCASLCKKVHGIERTNEVRNALALDLLSPFVALRQDRITAYASTVHYPFWGHGVAETEEDMKALILGASVSVSEPLLFFLPMRYGSLLRWCLSEGLRAVKPMTIMAIGKYHEPAGCYFASVFY